MSSGLVPVSSQMMLAKCGAMACMKSAMNFCLSPVSDEMISGVSARMASRKCTTGIAVSSSSLSEPSSLTLASTVASPTAFFLVSSTFRAKAAADLEAADRVKTREGREG